jgi:hypothetical protein
MAVGPLAPIACDVCADYQERISLFFDDRRFELIFPSPYLNHFQTRLVACKSEGMHLSITEHRSGYEEQQRRACACRHGHDPASRRWPPRPAG